MRKILARYMNGGQLVVALMIANILNFIFNAVLGRVLTLEQFSILTLANTLSFLIIIVLNSFVSASNNRVAYLFARNGLNSASSFLDYFSKKGLKISFLLTAIWALLIPVLMHIFHSEDLWIFVGIVPSIAVGIYTAIIRGYFQGTFLFTRAAILIATESISKLIYALLFVYFNLSDWAYLSIPLSVVTTFFMTLLLIKKKEKTYKARFIFPSKLLFATFLTIFSSTAFLSIDILTARHFLTESESGAYALLSLIGKMIFFLGSLLNVLVLTFASRDTGLNKNSTRNFYTILVINCVLILFAFIGLGVFGKYFVPLLFGEKSSVIIEYLLPYTFGILLFTIANAFNVYHLAKQQYVFAYNGLLAALILIIGIFFFHNLISDFVNIVALVSFLHLSIVLIFHVFYKDLFSYMDSEDSQRIVRFEKTRLAKSLSVSICLPAYNEEKNIAQLLVSLLEQETKLVKINKIVVVSSASTDKTDDIVTKFAKKYQQILLIKEEERNGKASAINTFLHAVKDDVVVVQSADTLPKKDTIEKLCRPFLIDKSVGMTGGAPIPVNNPNCFLGFVVHTWWWFHRHIPRFGEIIAFRNIIGEVSPRTSVDEAYIQAKFAQLGYKVIHIDDAVVYNKGSESVGDIIKQRRRIFNGHTRLMKEEHIRITNMTKSGIKLLMFEYKLYNLDQLIWLIGGIFIELWAIILAEYDKHIKRANPVVWDIASSTKDLSTDGKGN